jgi:hypothetical protein
LRNSKLDWWQKDVPKLKELTSAIFSPIAKLTSIGVLMSLTATLDLEIE